MNVDGWNVESQNQEQVAFAFSSRSPKFLMFLPGHLSADGCERILFWLVWKEQFVFFAPSPSSPAQGLDYLTCPAVLPATTTRRTSCTELMGSPAPQPEILGQRWTVILR